MEATILQSLLAHLRHDAQLEVALWQLWRQRAALATLGEALPWAVFILDGKRRVVWRNQPAAQLVVRGDMLQLADNNELNGADGRANANLRTALNACRRQELAVFALPSAGPTGEILAVAVALGPVGETETPLAALLVWEEQQPASPDPAWLQELYGLTQAEARLAANLAAGRSVNECAAQAGVSAHTARTHLKHIFAKTDTTRQSELVWLLCAGPATLLTCAGRFRRKITQTGDDKAFRIDE
jgi:DNA-binding CsgD family transcriptional regulator